MKKVILLSIFIILDISSIIGQVTLYPWPETATTSERYSVQIYQGCDEFDLVTHLSEPVLIQGPDGDGVTGLHEDRSLSYVQFAFEGHIEIEVTKTFGTLASRVEITPKAFGIDPVYFDGRTVRFRLDHSLIPSYVSVNFITTDNQDNGQNGSIAVKHGMMIFGDKPETNVPLLSGPGVANYTTATASEILDASLIYFPPGDHYLPAKFPNTDGRIFLTRNGQRIYIAGGAIVRGSIDADGKDNLSITGRGIITGEDFYWHFYQENGSKTAYIDLRGSQNSNVEGIVITNPTHHTIPSSNNTYMKNIKIIGWASNHDGVRSGSGSLMEEIFIKTSDDLDYARSPHEIRNSIMWPMRNGAFGQLGWNNLGTGFTTYDKIYFIHSEWDVDPDNKRNQGVIGSVLEQGVNLQQDTIRNIYAEDGTALIANLTIKYENSGDPAPVNGSWGELHHFQFKNILLEKPFLNSGDRPIMNKLAGFELNGAKATVHDIDFVNIIAGNTIVTNDNASQFFNIDPNTTSNITFRTEGTLFEIQTTHNVGGRLIPDGIIPTPAGMNRFIQIIPEDGKLIKEVFIDGLSVGRKQNVTFKSIQANHTVEVVFADGEDFFGAPYDCMSTSTHQIDLPPLEAFPNPTNDIVFLEHIDPSAPVKIYTVSGSFMTKVQYSRAIDMKAYPAGVYILKVRGYAPLRIVRK